MTTGSSSSAMKLLDQLYFSPGSTTDRGTKFERFTQSFLQTDPTWSQQFEKVWMWDQWPEKWGPDTGTDPVAERRDGGRHALCEIVGTPDGAGDGSWYGTLQPGYGNYVVLASKLPA